MITQNIWRRMVLRAQTKSTGGRGVLVKTLLLAAVVAQGSVQPAGATDADPNDAAMANIAVCKAADGSAEVTSDQMGNGWSGVFVQCNRGNLDGWDCYHDSDQEWNCNDNEPGIHAPSSWQGR